MKSERREMEAIESEEAVNERKPQKKRGNMKRESVSAVSAVRISLISGLLWSVCWSLI